MSFSLVLNIGATVISLIFAALSITFAILINLDTKSMNSFVADITGSFNTSPIFDFNVSKSGPSTFEEEELVLHKWPGIANGCDCRGIRASNIKCKNKICRGSCGRKMELTRGKRRTKKSRRTVPFQNQRKQNWKSNVFLFVKDCAMMKLQNL